MFFNQIKTVILLSFLSGLFLFLGYTFGGSGGLQIALIFSLFMNGIAYFFSDRIVLSMWGAKPLDNEQYYHIYVLVEELAMSMKLPMPKLWLIQSNGANAFATGRNPNNASIAITSGILQLLEPHELRGVLAHELAHVKNRDILLTTIAATLASAIGFLANMGQRAAFWGAVNNNRSKERTHPVVLFLVSLLVPIAATLVQLALSRSREYGADQTGAIYSKDPLALASALAKLENGAKHNPLNNDPLHASTASLFIVHPFCGQSLLALFSTHPPISARIQRLEKLYKKMFS